MTAPYYILLRTLQNRYGGMSLSIDKSPDSGTCRCSRIHYGVCLASMGRRSSSKFRNRMAEVGSLSSLAAALRSSDRRVAIAHSTRQYLYSVRSRRLVGSSGQANNGGMGASLGHQVGKSQLQHKLSPSTGLCSVFCDR